MADLNPPPPPPPSSASGTLNFTLESDDISSLLHTLLHHSSSAAAAGAAPMVSPPMVLSDSDPRQFYGSESFHGLEGMNVTVSSFYGSQGSSTFRYESVFRGAIESETERIGEFDYESEDHEASEIQPNRAPAKSSSKRTRAAEVHNMSEKRRRQRINEKMKALQKLIPNSNKTDKASMLDEAIEYLKQLQLQVQMLAMRNGSTLHPFYLPSTVPTVQPSQVAAAGFDEGNGRPSTSAGAMFSINQPLPLHNMFDLSNRYTNSLDQKLLFPMEADNGNLHPSLDIESSGGLHERPTNFSSPKEHCKDIKFRPLQLEVSRGENSSSGVSS
ncbi:hypothetical protein Drorol1_Dr00013656 [Drosera rotundifolia]